VSYSPYRSRDHMDRAPRRFIEQFKDKPKLAAILTSYIRQIQNLEDCAWEVIESRTIASSGKSLDSIGRIVGRKRYGLSDADYRIAIRAQIRINRSSGTAEDIIAVAKLSLPDYTIEYLEHYPASIQVNAVGAALFTIGMVVANLRAAKMGGVRLGFVYSFVDPSETFTLSSDTAYETDEDQGFGSSADATLGGQFASVTAA
jgi:hypothetical protein